jgi:Clp amino terminal domain, pathogenicity island component
MFERYTEKARRAIFFARYEASQYGSPKIEPEHLLLGVLREEGRLAARLFPAPGEMEALRKEIEAQLTIGPRISTSVEMPLSQYSKQTLNLAAQWAKSLGHRHVHGFHLIIGMLRVEKSTAARLLKAHSVDEKKLEAATAERQESSPVDRRVFGGETFRVARRDELERAVTQIVGSWSIRAAPVLARLFTESGQFGDSHGRQWFGAEVEQGIEAQFAALHGEVEQVAVENIQNLSMGSAVVTLRLTARGASSQRLVLVLRDIQMQWQIVSAHISLLEDS